MKNLLFESYLLLTLKHQFLHENIAKQPNNQFAKYNKYKEFRK